MSEVVDIVRSVNEELSKLVEELPEEVRPSGERLAKDGWLDHDNMHFIDWGNKG